MIAKHLGPFCVAGAALALGCARSDGPNAEWDPAVAVALSVEQYLAPGTAKVKLFEPFPPSFALGETRVGVSPAGAGSSLVSIVVRHGILTRSGRAAQEGLFELRDPGAAVRHTRPADAPLLAWTLQATADLQRLVAPGAGLVVQCAEASAAMALEGSKVVAVPTPDGVCEGSTLLGPALDASRVARARVPRNGELELSTMGPDGTVAASSTVTTPLGAQLAAVGEVEQGRVAAVLVTSSGLVGVDSMGATTPTSVVTGYDFAGFAFAGSRAQLFLLGGDAVEWDLGDPTATPSSIASPFPPEGFDTWMQRGTPGAAVAEKVEVDPTDDRQRVPVAYTARFFREGAFVTASAPSTPCVRRQDCRTHGESYLLAVLDVPAGPLGIYAFWAWTSPMALYLSPLAREEVP